MLPFLPLLLKLLLFLRYVVDIFVAAVVVVVVVLGGGGGGDSLSVGVRVVGNGGNVRSVGRGGCSCGCGNYGGNGYSACGGVGNGCGGVW